MSPGHVAENIRKDLEAGFDSVVSLLEDPRAIYRVGERLSKETDEHPQGVVMGELRDFAEILTPLLFPEASRLATPSQNEEPRRRRERPVASGPLPPLSSDPGALSALLAADHVGPSPATLETMRVRGGGPALIKLSRRVIYRREDLDERLSQRRQVSTSDG